MSLSAEMVWTAAGSGWATYGIANDNPVLIASGSLAAVGSGTFAALTWTSFTRDQRRVAVGLFTLATAWLVGGTVIGGANGLTATLAALGTVQFIPLLIDGARSFHRRDAYGVSPSATALRLGNAALWIVYASAWAMYGLLDVDYPLIAWGIAGVLAFTVQLAARARTPVAKQAVVSERV